jgi:hypothetical protein
MFSPIRTWGYGTEGGVPAGGGRENAFASPADLMLRLEDEILGYESGLPR